MWGCHSLETDFIWQFLKNHPDYEPELSEEADYLVYSNFGYQNLRYPRDCVRIFITGEDICPDFNLCDYAFGFEHLTLGDRYFRYPLVYSMEYAADYDAMMEKHLNIPEKTRFCSFVYSNADASPLRAQFFERLNQYKQVDSGGRFQNNVGGPVENKRDFEQSHKFSIAFENVSHPGYLTEKLMQSFAAGTVPIYWGDPMVTETFNPAAFINVMDFPDLDSVVDYVAALDKDPIRYEEMLRAPAMINPTVQKEAVNEELNCFLKHLFSQSPQEAQRTSRLYWNKAYCDRMCRWEHMISLLRPFAKILGR